MSFWKKKGDESIDETRGAEVVRDALGGAASASKPGAAPERKVGGTAGDGSSAVKSPTSTPAAESLESLGAGSDRYGKIRSALGPGTVIQGKLSFDTPVRIDGKLSGEVYSTKPLIVGETGDIQADVQVSALVVMGKVSGNIKATERIEILKTGEISGEISTPALVIEEGARFTGGCAMSGKAANSSQQPKFSDEDGNKKKQGAGSSSHSGASATH